MASRGSVNTYSKTWGHVVQTSSVSRDFHWMVLILKESSGFLKTKAMWMDAGTRGLALYFQLGECRRAQGQAFRFVPVTVRHVIPNHVYSLFTLISDWYFFAYSK
jgi:hypothetical protein